MCMLKCTGGGPSDTQVDLVFLKGKPRIVALMLPSDLPRPGWRALTPVDEFRTKMGNLAQSHPNIHSIRYTTRCLNKKRPDWRRA
jgi:hypothetical protein